jgi:hypothetical protein
MGPPPRSFTADAHDCIMVRIPPSLPPRIPSGFIVDGTSLISVSKAGEKSAADDRAPAPGPKQRFGKSDYLAPGYASSADADRLAKLNRA